MQSPQFPDFRGRSKVAWIEDGAYLMVRDEVERGEFPSGTWIIGGDDSRIWKIWREAPGFNQRFIGSFEPGGKAIAARWETSDDGSLWEKDFDLVYRRFE